MEGIKKGKKPEGKRSWKYPFFKILEVDEYYTIAEGTREYLTQEQTRLSSLVFHYNKTLKPKRFSQKTVDNELRIYRVK